MATMDRVLRPKKPAWNATPAEKKLYGDVKRKLAGDLASAGIGNKKERDAAV